MRQKLVVRHMHATTVRQVQGERAKRTRLVDAAKLLDGHEASPSRDWTEDLSTPTIIVTDLAAVAKL